MIQYPIEYNRCRAVARGPQPGTRALQAFILDTWPYATNSGIYNPRSVRGGMSLSQHACGSAGDVSFPGSGHPQGADLADWLVTHHEALGIQQVIWARRIWRNTLASKGWRTYSGTSPHLDHVHWEHTQLAAALLTETQILEAIGDDMQHPQQIEAWFTTRLVQLYENTGPNHRSPTPRDVQSWTDHLRTEGHSEAGSILEGVERLLANE